MLVISINGLIDVFYISHFLGVEAFTGVSMLFPLLLVVTSVTVCIASGSASMLSRAIGSGQTKVQRKIFPNMLALSLLSSFVLTTIGAFFAEDLVYLVGVEGTLSDYGTSYFKVYALGIFFSIYGLSANGLIRAEGKMGKAMNITMVAVGLNVALTPFFIEVLGLGVAGAAWSSITVMFVYCLLTSYYFVSGKASFDTGKFTIRLESQIQKEVLGVGLSAFSMQLSNVFRQFVLFRLVAHYGTLEGIAFFNAAFRLFSFMGVPLLGLYQSMQPIIGVNYGAGEIQRIKDGISVFRWAGYALAIFLVVPVLLFPDHIIQVMLPQKMMDANEIFNLRLILAVLLAMPISSSSVVLFQSLGRARLASALPIGRQFLLFAPIIWAMSQSYGLDGIYYSLVIENMCYALILWLVSFKVLKKISFSSGTPFGKFRS